MKKFIPVLVCSALVFTGCSSDNTAANTDNTVASVSVENIESDISYIIDEIKSEGKTVYNYSYPVVKIKTDGYEKLSSYLDSHNRETEEYVMEIVNRDSFFAAEQAKLYPDSISQFSLYVTAEPTRTDSVVFSYTEEESSYTGGAHGNLYSSGININPETGERLELTDVVTDINLVHDFASDDLSTKSDMLFNEYEDTLNSLFEVPNVQWVLDSEGLVLMFNPYELAPYAAGVITVLIPYESDLIKTEFKL